ncbi:hypothetical protein ACJJTC_010797 [Scirpophaga incertulas]
MHLIRRPNIPNKPPLDILFIHIEVIQELYTITTDHPRTGRLPLTGADILAQRRDELSHASIESAVLPSLPPRQPTHEDEVIMRNAEQPNSAWGRSRFSNGRDFNTEFIRSQQNAEAPPLPLSGPPEPQEPNANALPDKLPDRVKSPDQLADRREKSVHALVNSYQRMASARGTWDGQQQQSRHNNNWHSVETTSHFYTTNELGQSVARLVAHGASLKHYIFHLDLLERR